MWKRLSSKVLINHRFLFVEEDEVELQTGQRTRWLRYGHPGDGVVIVAINDTDDTDDHKGVLFLRQYSYVQQKAMLQLPMGAIDKDETPETCAHRELYEEGGVHAERMRLAGSYFPNHRRSNHTDYVFLASELTDSLLSHDELPRDEEETIECVWIPRERIAELVTEGEIVDSDTLSALRICGL
jgi:ADP-ribose pyrophosphatase